MSENTLGVVVCPCCRAYVTATTFPVDCPQCHWTIRGEEHGRAVEVLGEAGGRAMTDEEKIIELRKCLIYFIDLYFGPKWREIKREDGYITFHKLDEARKLLMVTQ